jgi:hypothetical protein
LEILNESFAISGLFLNDTPLIDVGDCKANQQNGGQHQESDIDDNLCSQAQIDFSK